MNEVLRIFKRTFKRFGYDLKKAGKFTLLPLQGQADPHLKVVYEAFDGENLNRGEANLDKLVVYIRTCLRANRNVDTRNRFTGASTAETVYRCLRSTIRAINHAYGLPSKKDIEVVILDDHSDDSYLVQIKELAKEIQCPWVVQPTRETGQGKSLHEQFELAKPLNALCYFCEDDYLHEVSAIEEMWDFYRQMARQTDGHLALHPQECEFLYQTHYPSYILAGEKRHWRTMNLQPMSCLPIAMW